MTRALRRDQMLASQTDSLAGAWKPGFPFCRFPGRKETSQWEATARFSGFPAEGREEGEDQDLWPLVSNP